jgi:signal recognition particle subunit SRP54
VALEGLSDKLDAAFKKLRSKGTLTETDVREAMREVRLALLEADVSYKVAKDFTNRVTEKAIGAKVTESLTPAQMVIKIVNEELTALMGGTAARLNTAPHPPTVVMMCGLQGSGKTTHAAKIAKFLKGRGHRPLLAACDIYRPAAIKQLQVIGEQAGVPVFEMGQINPVTIASEAIRLAKDQGYDYVLLDTAGRLHIDAELMNELKRIKAAVRPSEILLVVDAMTGQDAVTAAQAFHDALGIDGIIMTKLDGDSRGGAALSVKKVTGRPIKFMGTGEKLDALEVFHPDRMASRILGMGDLLSFIEKAAETADLEKAAELEKRLAKNQFTLEDFLDQIGQIRGMGGLGKVMNMIPGVQGKITDDEVDAGEQEFRRMEAIIRSMTAKERKDPNLLNASRRKRIAAGAGVQVSQVNQLIKKYEDTKKLMKQFTGKGKAGRRRKGFMGF